MRYDSFDTITSECLFFFRQSLIPCRIMTIRLSRASKWGSQRTGAMGSFSNDSRITCDSGFALLWNLKVGVGSGKQRDNRATTNYTYFRRTSSVDPRMRQHCRTGAKMDSSSWKGFPKPRPWSKCNGNVSFPKILERKLIIEINLWCN